MRVPKGGLSPLAPTRTFVLFRLRTRARSSSKGDVAQAVRGLKELPGNDLLLSGSAQLFNALLRENLIDLYRFMLHPIVLGTGRRLFADEVAGNTLDLVETKRFGSGIVILEYAPATKP
jgi:dihydrofolate reductase